MRYSITLAIPSLLSIYESARRHESEAVCEPESIGLCTMYDIVTAVKLVPLKHKISALLTHKKKLTKYGV